MTSRFANDVLLTEANRQQTRKRDRTTLVSTNVIRRRHDGEIPQ